MDKIKIEQMIISCYDEAFRFSIAIDGEIYRRSDIEKMSKNSILRQIYNCFSEFGNESKGLNEILKENYSIKELIVCEDGDMYIV